MIRISKKKQREIRKKNLKIIFLFKFTKNTIAKLLKMKNILDNVNIMLFLLKISFYFKLIKNVFPTCVRFVMELLS